MVTPAEVTAKFNPVIMTLLLAPEDNVKSPVAVRLWLPVKLIFPAVTVIPPAVTVNPPLVTPIPPDVTVNALAKVSPPFVPKSVPALPILRIGRLFISKSVGVKVARVTLLGLIIMLPVELPPMVKV